MKFRLLVKGVEKLLKMRPHGDEPRADMYLPDWVLAMGLVLICGGIVLAVIVFAAFEFKLLLLAAALLLLGAAAVLCWRNQTIRILDDHRFEYTTFLGNGRVYYFSEIAGLKRNSDSMTLLVADGKVHIENCAVFTKALADRINAALSDTE